MRGFLARTAGVIGYLALEVIGGYLIAREREQRIRLLADDLTVN